MRDSTHYGAEVVSCRFDEGALSNEESITKESSCTTLRSNSSSFDGAESEGTAAGALNHVAATCAVTSSTVSSPSTSKSRSKEQAQAIYDAFMVDNGSVQQEEETHMEGRFKEKHTTDSVLMEPLSYLLQNPGKNVRSLFIDAFNERWLRIPALRISQVKEIVNALHNSSLLIDDIEDGSNMRRGVAAAHCIFGVPSTINCANYVYMMALQRTVAMGSHDAIDVFTSEMLSLHRGQGHDIHWRDNFICPSESEYERMVLDKTGGLFRLAIKLLLAFSKSEADFITLVNNLSLYFQIRDDYLNLCCVEYMKSKDYCEDLTEGKFSYPVIHCLAHNRRRNHRNNMSVNDNDSSNSSSLNGYRGNSSRFSTHNGLGHSVGKEEKVKEWEKEKEKKKEKAATILADILRQRTESVELKERALQQLRICGSLKYTLNKLNALYDQINKDIADLGGNKDLSKLCSKLHHSVLLTVDEKTETKKEQARK